MNYCLNSNLSLGDIVLVRGAAKASTVISVASKIRRPSSNDSEKRFSHVAMCVENGMFVEAIRPAVQLTSAVRFFVSDVKNIKVLRAKPEIQHTVASAVRIGKNYLSRGYSVEDAIRSVIYTSKIDENGDIFCSYLVTSAFRKAGAPLLNRDDETVTPNCLLDSPCLENVTEEVVQPVRRGANQVLEPLDEMKTREPHPGAVATHRILCESNEFLASQGHEMVGDIFALVDAVDKLEGDQRTEADLRVCSIVRSSGLFESIAAAQVPTASDYVADVEEWLASESPTLFEIEEEITHQNHLQDQRTAICDDYRNHNAMLAIMGITTGTGVFTLFSEFYQKLATQHAANIDALGAGIARLTEAKNSGYAARG